MYMKNSTTLEEVIVASAIKVCEEVRKGNSEGTALKISFNLPVKMYGGVVSFYRVAVQSDTPVIIDVVSVVEISSDRYLDDMNKS